MKALAVIIICLIIIGAVVIALRSGSSQQEQYLRIHIRANSNDASDQSVKYKVKEKVVEYMSPKLDNVSSKSQAMKILEANLDGMKKVADATLAQNGYAYTANVKLCSEEFEDEDFEYKSFFKDIYDKFTQN